MHYDLCVKASHRQLEGQRLPLLRPFDSDGGFGPLPTREAAEKVLATIRLGAQMDGRNIDVEAEIFEVLDTAEELRQWLLRNSVISIDVDVPVPQIVGRGIQDSMEQSVRVTGDALRALASNFVYATDPAGKTLAPGVVFALREQLRYSGTR